MNLLKSVNTKGIQVNKILQYEIVGSQVIYIFEWFIFKDIKYVLNSLILF